MKQTIDRTRKTQPFYLKAHILVWKINLIITSQKLEMHTLAFALSQMR